MKKALLAAAAVVACMTFGPGAHAQMAVFDAANFANTLREVQTAASQLAQLNAQLQQMRQQYQMFTSPSNITGMLPALNAPSLQNPMPAASSMPGQIVGSANSLSSLGQTFYQLNHVFTATGTDPQANLLNRSSISTANIQGIAAANLASIEQRQASLHDMQTELQNATDNHGHADWLSIAKAREVFPGPSAEFGGVVVGEAYRVDQDKVAAVAFDPANKATWGKGGKAPRSEEH